MLVYNLVLTFAYPHLSALYGTHSKTTTGILWLWQNRAVLARLLDPKSCLRKYPGPYGSWNAGRTTSNRRGLYHLKLKQHIVEG